MLASLGSIASQSIESLLWDYQKGGNILGLPQISVSGDSICTFAIDGSNRFYPLKQSSGSGFMYVGIDCSNLNIYANFVDMQITAYIGSNAGRIDCYYEDDSFEVTFIGSNQTNASYTLTLNPLKKIKYICVGGYRRTDNNDSIIYCEKIKVR